MPFWDIRQNNSFGTFDRNDVVRENVIMEADTEAEATKKLEAILDSYNQSGDCPCCGDRWNIYFWDGGHDVPSRYSEPVEFVEGEEAEVRASTIIYYKDGTKRFAN